MKRKEMRGIGFLLPDLLGVICFSLLPFGQVVVNSFQDDATHAWAGLKNYRAVLSNTAFRIAVGNTLRFTLVCIPILVIISLFLAVLLSNLNRGRRVLQGGFLLPYAVPAASVVLVWKLLFHKNGLLNGLLIRIGLQPVSWMNSDAAFWILVVSYLWKNLGYDMVLWMAGLANIPPEIYEAARVDGAGAWNLFYRITLPNLKTSFFTITVLSFLNSLKAFREAWLVAGDYPHQSMYLMQHLYNNWFRELSYERISAAAVLNAMLVFGLTILLGRILNTNP